MSREKFTDFLKGFAAGNQLMNRAGSNGCFVEYVCLATSIIDGLIRVYLILKHQLDTKSCDIPTYISHQCRFQEMANEKHAHPILAKNLNATSGDIYQFANNLKKIKLDVMICVTVVVVRNIKNVAYRKIKQPEASRVRS